MITVCVLFNHPFPANIPALKAIYADRFEDVMFVQPMAPSEDPEVLTSYSGAYGFHGMMVDAIPRILALGAEHVVFIHDDVLLNPLLNENNIVDRLGLTADGAFLPEFKAFGGELDAWPWTLGVLWKLVFPLNAISGSGAEHFASYLPDPQQVEARLCRKYGFDFKPFSWNRDAPSARPMLGYGRELPAEVQAPILETLFGPRDDPRTIKPAFPLCSGMADFVVVSRGMLEDFRRLLGVFQQLGLFVEVAVPTALAAAAEHVVQSRDVGLRADWLWAEGREATSAATLIEGFRTNLLLAHPFKLSRQGALVDEVISSLSAGRPGRHGSASN
ncbi:hypothetical protein [Caulobacter sp. S45]|uniref:hypothetical protein n=1 Tax=Caulobacter sp. S45 TaxID=1641861 RepID=UPI001576B82C|nr:hypothetical protein [Caulobacter sp. S45]